MKSLTTLLAALLIACGACGCKKAELPKEETGDYRSVRDSVVEAIKAGKITANAAGVAVLPNEFKSASVNGQVFVGNDPSAGQVVAFPISQSGGRMHFLVHAEKPVTGGAVSVGTLALRVSGEPQGKWYQAGVASRPGR